MSVIIRVRRIELLEILPHKGRLRQRLAMRKAERRGEARGGRGGFRMLMHMNLPR